MDYALGVGEFQGVADSLPDDDRILSGHAPIGRVLDQVSHVAATHQVLDHVGLSFVVPQLKHGDNVRMGKARHGLRLAGDAGPGLFVQPLGLDQLEGDVTFKLRVAGEVDAFEPALTERLLDLVLAIGEGGGDVIQRSRRTFLAGLNRRRLGHLPQPALGRGQEGKSVSVVGIECKDDSLVKTRFEEVPEI